MTTRDGKEGKGNQEKEMSRQYPNANAEQSSTSTYTAN